jgi:hypothetical protein
MPTVKKSVAGEQPAQLAADRKLIGDYFRAAIADPKSSQERKDRFAIELSRLVNNELIAGVSTRAVRESLRLSQRVPGKAQKPVLREKKITKQRLGKKQLAQIESKETANTSRWAGLLPSRGVEA